MATRYSDEDVHETEMRNHDRPRSATSLISTIISDASRLVSSELKLAKEEVSDNMTEAAAGAGTAVGGLILLGAGFVIILQAIVVALTNSGIGLGWASIIVGGGTCLLATVLIVGGASQLTPSSLAPSRALKQHRKDRELIEEKLS